MKKGILLLLLISNVFYANANNYQTAVLSGGCFWCTEADIEKLPGIINVVSGYTGGKEKNPTYREVASGQTSHREGIKITYDPAIISYEQILNTFLRTIDPSDSGGSFVDRGRHYTAAIYVFSDEQKKIAMSFIEKIKTVPYFKNKNIYVPVLDFTVFYDAEEYHQDYYKKNALQYNFYRYRSGRDQFIEKVWDKVAKNHFIENFINK